MTPLETTLGEALEAVENTPEVYQPGCGCDYCKIIREALALYREAKEKEEERYGTT